MNIVDSSGWLEYFSDGLNANHFIPPLQDTSSLVVPVIIIYEVFKVVLRERGLHEALQVSASMQEGTVVDVTPQLAISAAKISLENKLPMADSIIFATARAFDAKLWTMDADFKTFPEVNCIPKR